MLVKLLIEVFLFMRVCIYAIPDLLDFLFTQIA